LIVILLALAGGLTPANWAETPGQEIIVLGEVQSAANTVTAFLQHLGLIDSERHWTGGNTILIQTGDLIDDGENVRATLDLFMRLQAEAKTAGGQVIVLMGNHEAANIFGELRGVNPAAYQSFAGPASEDRRRQAYEQWSAWRVQRAEAVGETFESDAEVESQWFESHPPGWVEYMESMAADGVYGGWLRTLPVMVEISEVLFVHGGVHPQIEERKVTAINQRAIDEIRRFDAYRERMITEGFCLPTAAAGEMVDALNQEAAYLNTLDDSERTMSNPRVAFLMEIYDLSNWRTWSVLDGKGPLSFRGAARWPEEEHGTEIASVLDEFEVERMVTGQSDGRNRQIQARFDNRVLLTSIDMSDDPDGHGGEPAALAITGGDFYVVTTTGRELLIDN
jgi:hypothetical protein